MSFRLQRYVAALRSPLATAHRIVDERAGALVSCALEGATGWGDLCPMPGWSVHDLGRLIDEIERASAQHVTPVDVVNEVFRYPEARAACAGAMHDALAQLQGLSLTSLLSSWPETGITALERVRVNATIGAADVSTALTNVNLAFANGITTMKLKVAHRPLDADLALVEAVRRSVGDEVEIRLDANGGWGPEAALDALERFAPYGIALCEEPTSGIDAIAAIGAESSVPVAVDESARTRADLDRAIASGSIGFVVVKPQAIGGPDLAFRAVVTASQAGVTPIVTSMIDSAVGVAHAVHVAAAGGVDIAHGLATSALLASDVAEPLAVDDGHIVVPTVPGLGVRPSQPPR